MNLPENCLFTPNDEWLRREGDQITLGLTDYGQNELGELVLIELPAPGAMATKGAAFGVVESVKAVSELISPVNAEIVATNDALRENPSLANESPYEQGWLVRLKTEAGALPNDLMNAAQYAAYRGLAAR